MTKSFYYVGKKVIRLDGLSKVTGQEKYTMDIYLPGMLYGRILRSPYAHAIVKNIDTSEAERLGAVVITFKDIPQVLFNPRLVSTSDVTYKDWKVLTNKPLYVGEPIAAVAAESEELAQKALEAIKVKYEVLKPVVDPIEAMMPDKPLLHERIYLGDKEIKVKNNIACELTYKEGDPDKAFEEADVILERMYRSGRRYHVQLEPRGAVCRPEPDGGVTLWTTTQSIHNTRILISQIFNIPINKVNVIKVALGGGFGSSIHTNIVVPICVALALKARKPVKLIYTREEDMYDHVGFSIIFKIKGGAKKSGELIAGELEAIVDVGAHQVQPYPLLGCLLGWFVSLYKWRNVRYVGRAVYTNKVPGCAIRGFGNPELHWAVETFLDELAEKLGIDPIEFKLKNYVGLGDVFWGQGPTVKSIIRSDGVKELVKKGAELIGWEKRLKYFNQKGIVRRGIGFARGFHTSGTGGPLSGHVIDLSWAMVKVNVDGTVDYITPMVDHGGGTLFAHAKIIAEELGIPLSNVRIIAADTYMTGYDVCTHASRGVYVGGQVARKAASGVKKKLLEYAARILNIPNPEALRIKPDEELGQGVIYVEGVPEKKITVAEVATIAWQRNWGSISEVVSYRPTNCPPSFTVYFVEVEVDTETGIVKPIKVVAGADVGTPINPDLVIGQLHGGFVMGWSMNILENEIHDPKTGDLVNKGFITDYKIPTAADIPPLDNFIVILAKTYEPTGPFGAKGIGEAATNPVAAAVTNAIYNALGIRFYELPITPEKILKALKKVGKHG